MIGGYSRLRWAAFAAVALVVGLLGLSAVLGAVGSDINGGRFAPVAALVRGYRLYYPQDVGPVLNTIYGPVSSLVYLPAALCNSPTNAILTAVATSAFLYFSPVIAMFAAVGRRHGDFLVDTVGVLCFAAVTVNNPSGEIRNDSFPLFYSAFAVHADASSLGFGGAAVALVCLRSQSGGTRHLMLASFLAVAAVCSKQNFILLPAALLLFTLLADGFKTFVGLGLRLLFTGVASVLVLGLMFGFHEMYFNLVVILSSTPLRPGLANLVRELLEHSLLPVSTMVLVGILGTAADGPADVDIRGWLRHNRWAVFAIVAAVMVPAAIGGRWRTGGIVNSWSPVVYFLWWGAIAALVSTGRRRSGLPHPAARAARAWLAILVGAHIVLQLPLLNYCLREQLPRRIKMLYKNRSEVAYQYARRHPGEVYFPRYPLSTLMAEGALYHLSYGLFERQVSGFAIDNAHFWAHVPPKLRAIAFVATTRVRGSAVDRYLPEFTVVSAEDELPGWSLRVRNNEVEQTVRE